MADQYSSPTTATPEPSDPLSGRTILMLPYSHLDWAWCFSRAWHEARYALILDEALRLAAADPAFCLFVDSLAEGLEPYLAARPAARERWNRLVAAGRVAVVGGQYVNLRPSTAPEETFIRNLEIGRQRLAELLPAAQPTGYANLDTAIGHSQLPQVLALAGLSYMMVGRSEAGLREDGVPPLFHWESPGGASVLVLVQHYGVCAGPFQRLGQADRTERAKAATEIKVRLQAQVDLPTDTVFAIVGADDARYLHDANRDQPIDAAAILAEWNQREPSHLALATPDQLVRRLLAQPLPRCRGAVDQGDVGYNGPFGQSGLRELRDRTAAALVEAEVYHSFATAVAPVRRPRAPLRTAWRQALRAQTHAAQYVFSADLDALRLDLALALRSAQSVRADAMERLAPTCLPQDTALVALFNPLPWPRTDVVAVPVARTDFAVPAVVIEDMDGTELPQQALMPANVHRPGEWDILLRANLPPGGFRTVRLRSATAAVEPRRPETLPLTGVVPAGAFRLTWEGGCLVRLESTAGTLVGRAATSILEPLCRPVERRGWLTTAIGTPTEALRVTSLRQTEWGPLRWCIERTAEIGPHAVRQWFHATDGDRLQVTTDIAYGPQNGFFTLAIPCGTAPTLSASVPFGVEPRHAGATARDSSAGPPPIERLIPGLFYARDWVRLQSADLVSALVVEEGDRYWLSAPGQERLEHLLVRATAPMADGWEQFTQMNRPGFMRFRHTLVIGRQCSAEQLSAVADAARFPVRAQPARAGCHAALSLAHLDCANVRILAWRRVGADTEVRLVESAGQTAAGTLTVQGRVHRARLVDFRGVTLARTTVAGDGRTMRVALQPWQIATLRFRWQSGAGPGGAFSPR